MLLFPWDFMEVSDRCRASCVCDASQKGYGACVYLRVPSVNKFKVSFVMSRGRVAPIKGISLARLELLGALLCARLVTFVKSALHLDDVSVLCWTDSTVV